jgi:protocatechuate 3,4-dioxygenase beta subunit
MSSGESSKNESSTGADATQASLLLSAEKQSKDRGVPSTLERASITGRVLDESDAPIEGARVCATQADPSITRSEEPFPRCALTGPDGRYVLEGLYPVETRLSAGAPSFVPALHTRRDVGGKRREALTLIAGTRHEGVDIVLRGGGVRVTGVVRDLAGGTIEGAMINGGGRWGRGARATAVSGDEGRFELWLEPGVAHFSALAEGYAPGSREAVAPGSSVEIFMTPESTIQGLVLRAGTGEPVADAIVGPNRHRGSNSVRTDGDGRFRISGLSPGRYKPQAWEAESFGTAVESVLLGFGESAQDVLIEVHPAFSIQGHIVVAGRESKPCPEGNLQLNDTAKGYTHYDATNEAGEIRIEAVQPGKYTVTLYCEGHLAEDAYDDIVVEDASVSGLRWEVREALAIRGRVLDTEGDPVRDVRVWAAVKRSADDPRGEQAQPQGTQSEEDGSFELGGLLPGVYTVSAWSRDRPAPREPVEVVLEGGADVNDVEIELPATGGLEGSVVDERGEPVEGAHVRVTSPGWAGTTTMCADDGSFSLPNVKVGSHRAMATTSSWGGSMRAPGTSDDDVQGERVEIVGGETARVQLVVESRGGTISGRVVDGDGQPVGDAYIAAQRESDRAGVTKGQGRRAARWGGWNRPPHVSDEAGEFEIDDLVEGATYTVRAHFRGGGETFAEGVQVGTRVELALMPAGELAGTVKVQGGGVPDEFDLTVRDRTSGYRSSEKFFRTEGRWRVTELPAGEYELELSSPQGNASEKASLAEGETRENIELIVQPKITVRGTLIDLETKEPVPGFQVRIQGGGNFFVRGGSDGPDRKDVSDDQGRFEVTNVPTGRVNVLAMARGFADDDYDMAWQTRTLAPEPAVQELAPIALVKRRLEREEKAGDLGFKVKQPEPDEEPEDRRQVVVFIRPGGSAEAAGLTVGDEIITIDGHDVTGIESARYRSLTSVPEGTKLAMGLREGGNLVLVAGPSLD